MGELRGSGYASIKSPLTTCQYLPTNVLLHLAPCPQFEGGVWGSLIWGVRGEYSTVWALCQSNPIHDFPVPVNRKYCSIYYHSAVNSMAKYGPQFEPSRLGVKAWGRKWQPIEMSTLHSHSTSINTIWANTIWAYLAHFIHNTQQTTDRTIGIGNASAAKQRFDFFT